eukprot:scaffold64266_cov58-Phaeocystis_antarctica.AAC.2
MRQWCPGAATRVSSPAPILWLELPPSRTVGGPCSAAWVSQPPVFLAVESAGMGRPQPLAAAPKLVTSVGGVAMQRGLYQWPCTVFSAQMSLNLRDDRQTSTLADPCPGTAQRCSQLNSRHPAPRHASVAWLTRHSLGRRPVVKYRAHTIDAGAAPHAYPRTCPSHPHTYPSACPSGCPYAVHPPIRWPIRRRRSWRGWRHVPPSGRGAACAAA